MSNRFYVNLLLIISTFQDKEEKERQMNSRAAVEETAEDRALNSIGLEEEIIELQDLRMSPIPSLRNRHKAKYYKEPGGRLHGMCPSLPEISQKTVFKLVAFLCSNFLATFLLQICCISKKIID